MIQACLYVGAFFVTYAPLWLYIMITMIASTEPAPALTVASVLICPLGGLFNILVFTRPSVWIMRQRHSISFRKAFVAVIKNAGEVPPEFASNQRAHRGDQRETLENVKFGLVRDDVSPAVSAESLPSEVVRIHRELEAAEIQSADFGRISSDPRGITLADTVCEFQGIYYNRPGSL